MKPEVRCAEMVTRAIALAAVCLAAAPAAGAANGRLLVEPQQPVVGLRTVIQVRAQAKAPLYAQLTSPTGVRTKLRLTQVRTGLWRAAYHFADDGQWTVGVRRAAAVAKVVVLQNGAALPPFKPNHAGATPSPLSGLDAPGVVIAR